MAQTGYTPIRLYYSSTPTAQPLAANLAAGELAVNTADGKLFFKNSSGVIATLADSSSATGNLPGGTAGSLVYQSATGVTAYLGIGSNDYILTSNGTTPVYTNPASITVGTAASATFATNAGTASTATSATTATNLAGGTTGQLAYQSGAGATTFASAPTGSDVGKVLSWNGSSFTWVSAPAATSTTNIAGGAQYRIPFQSGVGATTFSANLNFNSSTNTLLTTNVTASSSLTGGTVTANGAITTASNLGAFNYGTLSYTDTNIFASHQTSVNGYAQKVMQNTSNGSSASVDFIVSNDVGTATTFYGDFGMNSSTYSGTGPFQAANTVYLYSISTDLAIGTKSAHYLRFVTNDNAADSITINPASAVAFNGDYGVTDQILTSTGNTGAPVWKTPSAITIGTATNLAGGTAGRVPYQSGVGTTSFSAVGLAGQVLTSNGTSAPTWATVADNSLLWYFMG
jgi:hypothetical protein